MLQPLKPCVGHGMSTVGAICCRELHGSAYCWHGLQWLRCLDSADSRLGLFVWSDTDRWLLGLAYAVFSNSEAGELPLYPHSRESDRLKKNHGTQLILVISCLLAVAGLAVLVVFPPKSGANQGMQLFFLSLLHAHGGACE